MKSMITLGWVCLFFLTTAYSQPQASAALFPVSQNGKFGYIDTTGKFVISPQFRGAGKFFNGLAPIRISEKWGYVDGQGMIAINPSFDEACPFSEGRAAVKKGKKWGYIEKTGKFVIDAQFEDALGFSQGLAPVKRGDKWGYIDMNGKLTGDLQFDEAFIFSEGRALVGISDKYGYINRTGRLVIKPEFDWAGIFKNGLALVEKSDTLSYIDSTGVIALRLKFDDVGDFSEGLAPIQMGYLWGYIDTTGKIVIAPQFHAVGPFSEGLARVRLREKVGFIDRTGEYVIKPALDFAGDFVNGLVVFGVGDTEGYMDKSGKVIFVTNSLPINSTLPFNLNAIIITALATERGVSTIVNPTLGRNVIIYERAPKIIKEVNPQYPKSAKKFGLEGAVEVKVWVNKRGKVRRVIIQQSNGEMLNQAAAEAARQFEFKPAKIKGKSVEVWVNIPFHFRLNDSTAFSSEPEVSVSNDETPPPESVPFERTPAIIKIVEPIYPAIARGAGLEGSVYVKIWIDKMGKPKKVVIQKSASDIFDQAVIEAVRQFVFRPARMQSRPVDAWVSIPFHFRLR
jgi:TonB family protein